jgi:hypothetical protein
MGTEERPEGSTAEAAVPRKIIHIDMDAFYASRSNSGIIPSYAGSRSRSADRGNAAS